VFPTHVINVLELVPLQFGFIDGRTLGSSWWRVVPVMERQAAYAPLVFLIVITAAIFLTVFAVKRFYHGRARRSVPWDCGFARLDARMQDTAEGFGQPIRHIFEPFFDMQRQLPTPFDSAPHYRVTVSDRVWMYAYLPLSTLVQRTAAAVAWLQQGRIATYLTYSFVTLLVLLAMVL
jgi:hypothetical protein